MVLSNWQKIHDAQTTNRCRSRMLSSFSFRKWLLSIRLQGRAPFEWLHNNYRNVKHVLHEVFEVLKQIPPLRLLTDIASNNNSDSKSLPSKESCVWGLRFHAFCVNVLSERSELFPPLPALFSRLRFSFSSIRWISHSGSSTKQWVSFLLIWLSAVSSSSSSSYL